MTRTSSFFFLVKILKYNTMAVQKVMITIVSLGENVLRNNTTIVYRILLATYLLRSVRSRSVQWVDDTCDDSHGTCVSSSYHGWHSVQMTWHRYLNSNPFSLTLSFFFFFLRVLYIFDPLPFPKSHKMFSALSHMIKMYVVISAIIVQCDFWIQTAEIDIK